MGVLRGVRQYKNQFEFISSRQWTLGNGNPSLNIGDGPDEMGLALPKIYLSYANQTSLEMGYSHNCALFPAGQIQCWGTYNFGQL